MTDKQINYEQNSVIIDDIDVSECVYYKATGKYDSCGYYCEQNPNCYYKQLKRSEAQCEGMFVSHTDLEKKYKTLEEENRSLKKQLQFEFDETLLQYSNTIEDLQKQLNNTVMQKCPQCGEVYLNPVGAKLYEALIEIKELVQSDYCTEIGSCEFCAEIGNCLNRKILHKISEV